MRPTRILAIDAGTSSVRAMVVDDEARVLGMGARPLATSYPAPDRVEQDPEAIWAATLGACATALDVTGTLPDEVTCIGITNQRETAVLWDRASVAPLHPAIVWQDRRTADRCAALDRAGHTATVRATTGLVLDPYFSGTKLGWLLDEVPGARERAEVGDLAAGTVDTWILARATGGRTHATEPSNACRTMLLDLETRTYDPGMLRLLTVPAAVLPDLRDSTGPFGTTDPAAFLGIAAPVTGVLGDQQAALLGQAGWDTGATKCTYGTGAFLLTNTGPTPVLAEGGLLTSIAWQFDGTPTYVLEGAVLTSGASVQWLRDELGLIPDVAELERLAAMVPVGNEGVHLVPAFTGLGAPEWDPHARALLIGMTRGTDRRHLARAAIEAMAHQAADVVDLMARGTGERPGALRVDGGGSGNDLLCALQADLLDLDVVRPRVRETTALGAAMVAGLGAGVWASTDEIERVWEADRRFHPSMDPVTRARLRHAWAAAVRRSRDWARVVEGTAS